MSGPDLAAAFASVSRRAPRAALAATALLAAGCAAGPVAVPREALPEAPAAWTAVSARSEAATTAAEVGGWLDDFDAPGLPELVARALDANPDLAAAGARVAAARAQARIAGAPRLPSATLGLDAARTKRAPSGISATSASPVTTYGLDATVAWEADLWGRLGDTARAAVAERTAAEADYRAARLALAAEVAREWFALAEAEQQVNLATRTVASFGRSREVIEERYRTGLVDALDVRLARENEATARATRAQRLRERDGAVRALEVLLGRYPAAELAAADGLPKVRRPVPVGLPAELLERRPDLVAAEARLHAAGSRIGAAKKARLPSVTLTAAGGTASDRLHNLLDWDYLVWSLVGGITEPLFAGGRISGEVDLARARGDEAVADYATAVLGAFREVEAALSAEAHYAGQSQALSVAAAESGQAAELALERYTQGLTDIVTLLEAQRRAFTAESARLRTAREALDNRVDLYLALGGDFATDPPTEAMLR
jgi:multidrug efflux system outer membrane protein